MKKLLVIIIIFISPLAAAACDICGCGVGNSYIGILPDFRKHIFGLRYRYNTMLTHVGVNGSFTYLTTKEAYKTLEAWGGWTIGNRFRIMASVPYSFNERSNQENRVSKNGLGDITLSGYYQLLNKKQTVGNNLLVQSLWIGGGAKLATGTYNPMDKATTTNNTNLFQLGTGSTDFLLGLMYDIRLQDAGINLSSNYKMNTSNKYAYQYGNKFSVTSQVYYKIRVKEKITLAPNAGVQYEQSDYDTDTNLNVSASGGRLLVGTAGMEATVGRFATGINVQTPFSQNLAKGIVKANNRMMLHLAIAF